MLMINIVRGSSVLPVSVECTMTYVNLYPVTFIYLYLFFFKNWLFIIFYFIYFFLAVLGLRCCTQAFSSCGERGLLFVAVRVLLIVVVSLVVEHGF